MSNLPTTIIVSTIDPINFPLKMLFVVMKQVFIFGVKEILMKNNVVQIDLFYSPKSTTLKRKFGNLPLKYVRMKIANDEELLLLGKAIKKYNFNLDEGTEEVEDQVNPAKRVKYNPLKELQQKDENSDSDDDHLLAEAEKKLNEIEKINHEEEEDIEGVFAQVEPKNPEKLKNWRKNIMDRESPKLRRKIDELDKEN